MKRRDTAVRTVYRNAHRLARIMAQEHASMILSGHMAETWAQACVITEASLRDNEFYPGFIAKAAALVVYGNED